MCLVFRIRLRLGRTTIVAAAASQNPTTPCEHSACSLHSYLLFDIKLKECIRNSSFTLITKICHRFYFSIAQLWWQRLPASVNQQKMVGALIWFSALFASSFAYGSVSKAPTKATWCVIIIGVEMHCKVLSCRMITDCEAPFCSWTWPTVQPTKRHLSCPRP